MTANLGAERGSPGRAWLAVLSLALGSFASVTAEFLPVGVLPQVAREFGVSDGSAGLMMTLPGILAAVAAPGVMLLAGKANRRRVLLILSSVLVIACLLSASSTRFEVMLLSRALVGISLGAFWAMALAVAVRLVEAEKSNRAAAMVFAGVTAAMILGVPLGTLIADYFSWRAAFITAGLIAVGALAMQLWVLPAMVADNALRLSSLTRFIQRAASRQSMLMITLIFAAHFGTYTFVAPLLQHAGIGASSVTFVLLGYGIAGFLANFVAGHFVGRNLRASLFTAKVMLLIAVASLPLMMSLAWLEIGLILLWGLAWGALPLSLNTWNRSVSGSDTEASSAMFTFTAQIAIAVGSGVGGLIVDRAGLSTVFRAGAGVVLISTVLLMMYKPSKSGNAPAG